jgi:hypothetical protein
MSLCAIHDRYNTHVNRITYYILHITCTRSRLQSYTAVVSIKPHSSTCCDSRRKYTKFNIITYPRKYGLKEWQPKSAVDEILWHPSAERKYYWWIEVGGRLGWWGWKQCRTPGYPPARLPEELHWARSTEGCGMLLERRWQANPAIRFDITKVTQFFVQSLLVI